MKASPFQIMLIVIFLAGAFFGVLVFAGVIKIGNEAQTTGPQGTVTLWGTVRGNEIRQLIDEYNSSSGGIRIRYSTISRDTFDQDLLEAIASGRGPDMFFISDDLVYSYSNKISVIPYDSYPLINYKNIFSGASDVFLNARGVMALPITVDPLVMYYNKTILDTNGIIYPPAYWDDFVTLVPKLTQKDDSRQIIKSTVAMGQFSNIVNAKDILATLFLQAGSKIVYENQGFYITNLRSAPSSSVVLDLGPFLAFYTSFADPLHEFYSWNRSLPNSDTFFSSGNSAFYFGFASELPEMIRRNPNQNLGVFHMPQIKNASFKTTRAKVTGLAISSSTKNFTLAYTVANTLAMGDFAEKFSRLTNAPPARRDLLAKKPENIYGPVFYESALYGRSWIDPEPVATSNIFRTMVENVLSNTYAPGASVGDANAKLNLLIR